MYLGKYPQISVFFYSKLIIFLPNFPFRNHNCKYLFSHLFYNNNPKAKPENTPHSGVPRLSIIGEVGKIQNIQKMQTLISQMVMKKVKSFSGLQIINISFNKWQYTRRPSSPSQFSNSINLEQITFKVEIFSISRIFPPFAKINLRASRKIVQNS